MAHTLLRRSRYFVSSYTQSLVNVSRPKCFKFELKKGFSQGHRLYQEASQIPDLKKINAETSDSLSLEFIKKIISKEDARPAKERQPTDPKVYTDNIVHALTTGNSQGLFLAIKAAQLDGAPLRLSGEQYLEIFQKGRVLIWTNDQIRYFFEQLRCSKEVFPLSTYKEAMRLLVRLRCFDIFDKIWDEIIMKHYADQISCFELNLRLTRISFNSCSRNRYDVAAKIVEEFRRRSNRPLDGITYNILIVAYGIQHPRDFEGARRLLREMESSCKNKAEISSRISAYNALLSEYVDHGSLSQCVRFYKEFEPNNIPIEAATMNLMIKAQIKAKDLDTALLLQKEFEKAYNLLPNLMTMNTLLEGCFALGRIYDARRIYFQFRARLIRTNIITFNILIKGFGDAKDFESVEAVLNELKYLNCPPNAITYGHLINIYASDGQTQKALEYYNQMKKRHLTPRLGTYLGLLKTYNALADLLMFKNVMLQMYQRVSYINLEAYELLLDTIKKTASKEDDEHAYQRLKEITHQDLVRMVGREHMDRLVLEHSKLKEPIVGGTAPVQGASS